MCICACACAYMGGEWRVVTGTDSVPVILFITVGAHVVSVVDSMINIHLSQDRNPSLHVWISSFECFHEFSYIVNCF